MTFSRAVAFAVLVLSSACGSSSGTPELVDAGENADAGDAGWAWNGEPDAGTPDAGPGKLSISAMPIYVNDTPTKGEQEVSGTILVMRGHTDVEDAFVKVNGTLIGPSVTGGFYDLDNVTITGLGPGSTITLTAETLDPPETVSLTFRCPDEIEFSAPAANSLVGDEVDVNVTWAPGIAVEGMRMAGGAMIGFFACFNDPTGDVVSAMGHGSEFISLTVGQTSQTVKSFSGCARHLLELQYPGEMVMTGEAGSQSIGICSIRHRRWLRGPHP